MTTAIDILDEMINELMKLSTSNFHKKDPILLIEEAKSRIQALWDGWIPVTERLPENYLPVNIVYQQQNYPDKKDVSTWFINKDGRFYDCTIREDEWYPIVYPTHWMPLPNTPSS